MELCQCHSDWSSFRLPSDLDLWVGVVYTFLSFPVRLEFPSTSLMGPWSNALPVAIQAKVHLIQKPGNCNLMCAFQFQLDTTT
jgi:hypothetical protein